MHGAPLSLDPRAVLFGTINLSGRAQTAEGVTLPWHVIDPSGPGTGWCVTLAATDFQDPSGRVIPVSGVRARLAPSAIESLSGNTAPIAEMEMPTTLAARHRSWRER